MSKIIKQLLLLSLYCVLHHYDDDQGTFSDSEDDGVGGNVYQRQGFIIKTPNLKYDQCSGQLLDRGCCRINSELIC